MNNNYNQMGNFRNLFQYIGGFGCPNVSLPILNALFDY